MKKPKKSQLKKNLTQRNALLISEGAKMMGSYEDAYMYIEERLFIDEADSVYEFCQWLEKNYHRASSVMPFTEFGYPMLYKNYFLKEYK